MKTVEIIGYNRANLGKAEAKRLRHQSMVPCVIYGGEKQVHFYAPMILFREIVYTAEAHFVHLNIEGNQFECILQDIQFHPVSETILHADFLQLFEGKLIKMDIPVHFVGKSAGVTKGGTLVKKRRTLRVNALPKNMPDYIDVDISELDFGRAIKVSEVVSEDFDILDTAQASVAVVEIPRALRSATDAGEGEEGTEEGTEEATETAAE
ncbi:MAG: large subunit ribosomal protein L25 [Cyclobacteriaceae bacterium]|jgi:large subunit ribosomal protein L25